jgi:transposase-like protein
VKPYDPTTVPGKTTCPRCGKIGLVRVEHIIHAGQSYHSFECMDCTYQWQVLDTGEQAPTSDSAERPDRSR